MTPRPRLSASTLQRARVVDRPDLFRIDYDRTVTPTIAHVGVGAFARAHLGVYADDLLRQGWPATIRGVSLRGRRAEDQLAPQDGLYSVVEREPGVNEPLRVIGALTSMDTGPAAAVEAIAAPTTSLVTLTVTEKGYELDPHDLVDPERPRSAPGVVALGLARRRRDAIPAPVVASLDNVLGNGEVLRARVLEVAERLDPTLPSWIEAEVRFPSSVVDRMVPATTPSDLEEIAAELGLADLAAVTAEHHRSWVIGDVDGLPPLADVGVEVVRDVAPYERRKLWLLNGPHSALAYCGLVFGCETIAEAAAHPQVSAFTRGLVDDVLEVADLPAAVEATAFAMDALERFRNPNLGHTCAKVAEDGSRKLPQRLLPVVAARLRAGRSTTRCAVVVAAWLAAVAGLPVGGRTLPPVTDPAADELRAGAGDLGKLSATALAGRVDDAFIVEVAVALDGLLKDGGNGIR